MSLSVAQCFPACSDTTASGLRTKVVSCTFQRIPPAPTKRHLCTVSCHRSTTHNTRPAVCQRRRMLNGHRSHTMMRAAMTATATSTAASARYASWDRMRPRIGTSTVIADTQHGCPCTTNVDVLKLVKQVVGCWVAVGLWHAFEGGMPRWRHTTPHRRLRVDGCRRPWHRVLLVRCGVLGF